MLIHGQLYPLGGGARVSVTTSITGLAQGETRRGKGWLLDDQEAKA